MKQPHCETNHPIPDFTIEGTANLKTTFSSLQGKNVILFFYPKDNTPVCTAEAKAFSQNISAFDELNTVIFGVSRDTIASHERFKAKLALKFELISDTSEELSHYFTVLAEKNFFGKKIKGIIRSTFLIDSAGILRSEWRNIKVKGHTDLVLASIKQL
jgi:peroxiredoxin Q/BCP